MLPGCFCSPQPECKAVSITLYRSADTVKGMEIETAVDILTMGWGGLGWGGLLPFLCKGRRDDALLQLFNSYGVLPDCTGQYAEGAERHVEMSSSNVGRAACSWVSRWGW